MQSESIESVPVTDPPTGLGFDEKVFVDTNVFAYLADSAAPKKQARARHILAAHGGQLIISTQVLFELHQVLVGKLAIEREAASGLIGTLARLRVVPTDRDLALEASRIAAERELSIYDAAILAAAERAQCPVLLTDDAELRAAAGGLRTIDPFA
jgi:predicted nucleic acid-binding protein